MPPNATAIIDELIDVELGLFERFVDITDGLWWALENHPYLQGVASAALILMIFMIFRYHLDVLKTHEFFVSHPEIAGRFSYPTYNAWRVLSVTVLPVGIFVLCFSLANRGRSNVFLAVFGIRGTNHMKETIIRRAMRYNKGIVNPEDPR